MPQQRIAVAPSAANVSRQEAEAWTAAADSGDMVRLDDYLRRFPYGAFALQARQRLEMLRVKAYQTHISRKVEEQIALQELQQRLDQASRATAPPPSRGAADFRTGAQDPANASGLRPARAAPLALSSVTVSDASATGSKSESQTPYVSAFAVPEGMVKCLLPGGAQRITMRAQCLATGIVIGPH